MEEFNIALFLIFLIIFIIKNDTHQLRYVSLSFLGAIGWSDKPPPLYYLLFFLISQ